MITQALLDLLAGLVNAVLLLFPTWTPPAGPGLTMFAAANIVLPLDTIAALFGATVALMSAGGIIWCVMKVVNVLRGSGA